MTFTRLTILTLIVIGFAVCCGVVAASLYDMFNRPSASDVFFFAIAFALACFFAWSIRLVRDDK